MGFGIQRVIQAGVNHITNGGRPVPVESPCVNPNNVVPINPPTLNPTDLNRGPGIRKFNFNQKNPNPVAKNRNVIPEGSFYLDPNQDKIVRSCAVGPYITFGLVGVSVYRAIENVAKAEKAWRGITVLPNQKILDLLDRLSRLEAQAKLIQKLTAQLNKLNVRQPGEALQEIRKIFKDLGCELPSSVTLTEVQLRIKEVNVTLTGEIRSVQGQLGKFPKDAVETQKWIRGIKQQLFDSYRELHRMKESFINRNPQEALVTGFYTSRAQNIGVALANTNAPIEDRKKLLEVLTSPLSPEREDQVQKAKTEIPRTKSRISLLQNQIKAIQYELNFAKHRLNVAKDYVNQIKQVRIDYQNIDGRGNNACDLGPQGENYGGLTPCDETTLQKRQQELADETKAVEKLDAKLDLLQRQVALENEKLNKLQTSLKGVGTLSTKQRQSILPR